MKKISCPPSAPVLMESTRALGYSLEAAIADIIDNSISAQATKIQISFFPINNPYLCIVDNGHGMSSDQLTIAMRYGSSNPLNLRNKNDMGRFGLGMKTASLAHCRQLTVISLKDKEMSARQWDLDEIYKCGEWDLLAPDMEEIASFPGIEELKGLTKGTAVVWQKLDKLFAGDISPEQSFAEKMDIVRNHISLVFHRYLTGEPGLKRISISINQRPVEPVDPFLIRKSDQAMDVETILVENEKVLVTPYILPHVSKLTREELESLGGEEGLRKKQGFYIYRNKRLLIWGTWFRLMRQDDLYKLARVKVDIPNSPDHLWSLDIRKSTATPPEVVRKNLAKMVNKIADGSRRKWTFRGKKELSETTVHVWSRIRSREGIRYQINREHPLTNLIIQQMLSHDRGLLEQLFKLVETSFPLNAVYLDLKEDELFATSPENPTLMHTQIMDILARTENQDSKILLLDAMNSTEPYSLFPDLLKELKKEICANG